MASNLVEKASNLTSDGLQPSSDIRDTKIHTIHPNKLAAVTQQGGEECKVLPKSCQAYKVAQNWKHIESQKKEPAQRQI